MINIKNIKYIFLGLVFFVNFNTFAESFIPTVSNLSLAPASRQSGVTLVPTNSWSSPFTIPSSPVSSPLAVSSDSVAISVGEIIPASISLFPSP